MLKNIRQIGRSKNGKADSKANDKSPAETVPPSITDPSEKIRAKAVSEHKNADTVLQLAISDGSEMVRHAAGRRYAQLVTDTEAVRSTLLNLHTSVDHRALFFSVTAHVSPLSASVSVLRGPHATIQCVAYGADHGQRKTCPLACFAVGSHTFPDRGIYGGT